MMPHRPKVVQWTAYALLSLLLLLTLWQIGRLLGYVACRAGWVC